ncbi:MAG TPA: amino acid adenylation domain-containing protein, partial [Thermoanaerobaculia bacterium]|nr:amino acid adenylation domain-containing protein [Thermoanaerobaculia bacterium]
NRAETEGLIGFFVNTLVLRASLAGDPPFRSLLKTVRETALAASAHQDLPFDLLVEELRPERHLSRTPFFQVMLNVYAARRESVQPRDLRISPLGVDTGTAKFDLTLTVLDAEPALALSLEFAADLFEAPTAARLLGHLETLLAGAVAAPGTRLSDLALLTAAELHQAAFAWNDTRAPYPREAAIHHLFAEWVEKTPDAVALVSGDASLTYRELDTRSSRLARHLRSLGVGPETLVALAAERSSELIVAILGILKAGGAYVPLDPESPKERLAWLLADTGAPVLLAQPHLLDRLPESSARTVLLSPDEIGGGEDLSLPRVAADQLAYVMYTSGTTGRPKGVAVPHRAVARLVRETGYARFGPDEVFLLLAPVSFDASTLEIWGALANGARLVLFPPEKPSLESLGEAIERHGVTTLWLTAGLFHPMVEQALPALRPVRQLLAGGDVLSAPHVRAVLEAHSGCRVINGYGPTENTTFTCCHPMDDPSRVGDSVPIGRPIASTRAVLLDRWGRPVAIGVPGELHAGGDGLSRGYLGQPGLTAERFVPDPLGEPGGRLYRTGDLARFRPDGTIEFLGRIDQQVKIRGFRVEPGEIEATLAAHEAVGEALVAARPDPAGGRRLVAWIVPRPGAGAPSAADLRAFLRDCLPEPMIPAAWVFLSALPLTPNGKVDRRALPEPGDDRPEAGEASAPRTATEEVLAGIWAEALGLSSVGTHDSFFDLGGHSLLATKVVSRLRSVFGVELPLRLLFEAPTVSAFAAAVDEALGAGAALDAPPIVPVPRGEGLLPVSFAQRRLWFLDQLSPGSAVYNVPLPLRLEGPLDPGALGSALTEVVRRHEALRTLFTAVEGEPWQRIAPPSPVPLPVADLSGLPEDLRRAELASEVEADSLRPFDPAAGPLFRAVLLRLAPEEHVLSLGMHHIVSDGWSLDVLLGELLALYEAFSAGRPSPLPELPVQYADFAAWQRQWLAGGALERQLAYWRGQLAGAPTALDFPTDRPRPAVRTFGGASRSALLPAGLSDAARAFCRREGITLFMLMLAALDVLLARASGQDDVLVGTPIANRNRAETEGLIGFFVNTLVLRTRLSGAPTFRELLRRVRETALAAYSHQDLPFETLVEELKPERDLSHSPFFQVMLSVQNAGPEAAGPAGLRIVPLDGESRTAKFELSLAVGEGEELWTGLEYNTGLFEEPTIVRLLARFRTVLEAALATAESPVRELPLLGEAERTQILREWNDTEPLPAPALCLHQLFEAQAARTPDAMALVTPEARLSYHELDARAELLAGRLRAWGIGPEVLAGVLLDRGADLIVSLLAILKAGGAYVPIDPAYPEPRVRFLLENSRAAVLITRRDLLGERAESLPAGTRPLFLDASWETEVPAAATTIPPVPGNLAYLIYTSGSTGVPKGVAIEHRSAVAFAFWAREAFPPEALAGVLAATSVCFDLSIFEIFVPLAWGGRVILAENALALPDLPAAGEVTLVNTVPSAMAELVRSDALPRSVRTVNLAGEPLKGVLVRQIHERPDVEVRNLYGPSEDTTYSTFARMPRGVGEPSIGRPVSGTRAYLLDAALKPVPIGVPGALYLAGAGLARGYLGRPDLTAERFLPDPFGPPGSRFYRTGDLARFRPDGELDFLGRLDHQVKVRGFRIELGEVEAALSRHPEVRESAVLVLPEGGEGGGQRLVAYVASTSGLPGDLRAFLKERLPEYMVPGVFVPVPALPLTPNGKLDRAALAEMGTPEAAEAPRIPAGVRSPVEEVLSGIWAEIFGHPVGRDDNFFELGGHSLLATRAASRIRSALHVELPLQRLFETPTVAGLADWIEREVQARRGVPLPPIERASRDGVLPLSFAQHRLWFVDTLEPGTAVFNLPSPLRLTGSLDLAALRRSLDEIVRRHEALRTVFGTVEGAPCQSVQPAGPVSLPVADLSALPEERREDEAFRAADAEARQPFDLSRGPLLRTSLVKLGPEEHLLLVTAHHIVTDGWSTEVFTRELAALYEAFAASLPSPLPEPLLQYPDFAVWQRRSLTRDVIETLLASWKLAFGTSLPPLALPTDRPRPAVQTYPGGYRSARLSPELSGEAHRLAQRSGATLFMTLLAAFQALLHRWSGGQERIVAGSPGAGRNRAELEGLIGFFVNTLVLPGDLSGDPSFRDLLERARDMALAAYACQDLPFEKLVEVLQPVRDRSRSPLFQVMFSLQTAREGEPAAGGGLGIVPFGVGTRTSQFDLTLFVVDAPEGIFTGVEYNTDLFDEATIDRLLARYRDLLEAAVADPGRRLSELVPAHASDGRGAAAARPERPMTQTDDAASRRAKLEERRGQLSDEKRRRLEERLRGGAAKPAPAAPARCLVEITPAAPGASRRPFFCIHPAGGDVLCFFPLARALGADQPFYGLQARGLEDGGEPFATIEEMAARYVEEIRGVQPSGPYLVGGWSFGGLAAFEVARRLAEQGEEVALLAVLDTGPGLPEGAPADPALEDESDHTRWLLTIADYIRGLRGKDLGVTAADLAARDPEEQLRLFFERLKAAGIVHAGDTVEQLRRLLRVYRTNVRAFRTYVPRAYPGGIALFRAEAGGFDASLGAGLGWERLSPRPVRVHEVPGDHVTLLAEPHVRVLAERLRACLDASQPDSTRKGEP